MASDHAGFILKSEISSFLIQEGHNVIDSGTYSGESCDYPDYATKATSVILEKKAERGIFICGTGIGISIAANRHKGIRATLCYDIYTARLSRLHNDSNVLVLGANIVALALSKEIVKVWLDEKFEGGRHQRRIDKLDI